MENHRQIVADIYIKNSLKQCIGTTAYIQFMENLEKSRGKHSFRYIIGRNQLDICEMLTRAFSWTYTEQGWQYWHKLSNQWKDYVFANGMGRTLSYILKI